MGYRSVHSPKGMLQASERDLEIRFDEAWDYEALVGTPIPLFFDTLDGVFPGSKFILTVRDEESWADSAASHYTKTRAAARRVWYGNDVNKYVTKLYGRMTFERGCFLDAYARHEEKVRSHFSERPDDLLVLDVCDGEGWDRLCGFLSQPVPNVPFPRKNKRGSIRNYIPSNILRIARGLCGSKTTPT